MRLKLGLIAGIALLCASPAFADQILPFSSTQIKVTMTGSFVQALAKAPGRSGCTIQNNGTHTMFIFFGDATPADTTTSFQLAAGQAMNCTMGGLATITDQALIEGTSSDVAVVSSQ